MRRKIRVVKPLDGVYMKYQPELGKIYDADYFEAMKSDKKRADFCIIDLLDKRIVVRHGEFEFVEE